MDAVQVQIGAFNETVSVVEHPFASVTVTVYGPALSPEMEELVWPELHE